MRNKPTLAKPLTLAQIGDTKKPTPTIHPHKNLGTYLHPKKGR